MIAIVDETGGAIVSERRALGLNQLSRRSSKNFYFSTSLAHELRSGERITVNIVRAKSQRDLNLGASIVFWNNVQPI